MSDARAPVHAEAMACIADSMLVNDVQRSISLCAGIPQPARQLGAMQTQGSPEGVEAHVYSTSFQDRALKGFAAAGQRPLGRPMASCVMLVAVLCNKRSAGGMEQPN
jgi:hypothetical protein